MKIILGSMKRADREEVEAQIRERYNRVKSSLTERARRLFVAAEALAAGYGGIAAAARATGMAPSVIGRGVKEAKALESGVLPDIPPTRSRRVGGGRKKVEEKYPDLLLELKELVEATTRGDPESPLLWTARSLNVGTTASVVMDIDGGFNQHIIELVKQIYAAQEPYEPWLRNMQALAHVGIVRSHDSLEFRPGAETDLAGRIAPHAQDFAGWCQVLVATHQLWDLVPSHLLTPEHLRRFDVLILPSVSCMSHAECAAVRAWLTAGGTLIASGETSLYDPDGNLQDDFQLADVFGALFVEDVSPERSYAKIEDAALAPEHAWVDGTLAMDGGQLAVTASDSAEVLGTIHGNPGIRMVNVLVRRREPALLRHRVGAGTCTYFAGAVGRQYRRCGQANILTVLSRLLDQAMGAKAAVALDAPTSVELFAHTQKGQPHMVVNLVNIFAGLSRSDGRVILGPTPGVMSVVRHDEYQESPRLSQVVVRFREDPGRSIQRVYLAPSQGTELPLEREGNEVLVTVRDLGEHAMLVAEYEN